MFGKNPIRKPEKGDGSSLDVVSIFPTLQGEGPNVGQPAIFIRLGGCNLACSFCDTEFEDFKTLGLVEILAEVESVTTNQKLIVITGGEPLRQPIENLCKELSAIGFKLQIETNGTLYRDIPEDVEIICSPKTKTIDPRLNISAFKFIISAHNEDYNAIKFTSDRPIYVQPMDEYNAEKNKANMELAKNLALENGYILSLQTHKIIGVE